ncbi:ExbD/TolR family protein [Pseudoroseicyclus aestuarii]|uniref:Biopolymer transport protein ExbD n=1 Tax=Pseudoroseicyclus aestuarii TaxID=1795041 RepID=A0A318SYG5_9RHOB|nr:biopolymer transporter ExbD [Pseudoroseicyclus aestuarii]PYE84877.1 biopolymer transport protein ExbD [Pseudoroseicyclus aestuarii]
MTGAGLAPARPRRESDPTIALINIVFLMLIFFLIAGQLAPPLDPELTLVDTSDMESAPPPDALVLDAAGALSYRGAPVTVEGYVAERTEADLARVRLVPDADVPAQRLVEVAAALREAGAGTVALVTRQALE